MAFPTSTTTLPNRLSFGTTSKLGALSVFMTVIFTLYLGDVIAAFVLESLYFKATSKMKSVVSEGSGLSKTRTKVFVVEVAVSSNRIGY